MVFYLQNSTATYAEEMFLLTLTSNNDETHLMSINDSSQFEISRGHPTYEDKGSNLT